MAFFLSSLLIFCALLLALRSFWKTAVIKSGIEN
jgi:hypothetical protein